MLNRFLSQPRADRGLLIAILTRAAGETPPEPGPPPNIGFVEGWLTWSLIDSIIFFPLLLLVAVLHVLGRLDMAHSQIIHLSGQYRSSAR